MNLLTVWKNRDQILEGILNKIFTKEHVEEVALERLAICRECEFYGNACLLPGTEPCCSICGCCLELKTRSLSSDCPEHKWDAIMTEEEEYLFNENL